MSIPLKVADEVAEALSAGRGIVAFESTIITHGMAYPANLEMARLVEQAVRDGGATPATIAVSDGKLRVGLGASELEELAEKGEHAAKVSRRDLPFILQRHELGGTTVAATMIIAAMAGIDVFATGGIGGVHRGATSSFDISADLQELARTDVTVVCAGMKSILDIGLTLEYLETLGVPVVGFGTDVLPAFYKRDSGFAVEYRVDTASEVAAIMNMRRTLELGGGMVVANPIPIEHAMASETIDAAIAQALADADRMGIGGKEVTPFLLGRIVEITGSASLEANVQLVLNNAKVAAAIAVESVR